MAIKHELSPRAATYPFWNGVKESLPLVFTEALSYYQCIFLLYQKMNEIIDMVNDIEKFYEAMVNYLKLLYENTNSYGDPLVIKTGMSVLPDSNYLSYRSLLTALSFENTAEAKSINILAPIRHNTGGTSFIPDNAVITVSFMFNGNLRSESFNPTNESHLIVTTGNFICVFVGTHNDDSLCLPMPMIYPAIAGKDIQLVFYSPYATNVVLTTEVDSVQHYHCTSGIIENVPVTSGNFSITQSGLDDNDMLILKVNKHILKYPMGVLYNCGEYQLPDLYIYTLPDTNDEIVYFNYDGEHTVTCTGQSIRYSKPLLNYYNVTQNVFDCFTYEFGIVFSRNERTPLPEDSPYDEAYEQALLQARAARGTTNA